MTDSARNVISLLVMVGGIVGGGVAWSVEWPFLAVGFSLSCYAWVAWQLFRAHRFWRYAVAGILLAAGGPPLLMGVREFWCRHRPQPSPTHVQRYVGVEYFREVLSEPRSAVIHILRIDLSAEGVEVLVTPPDFPGEDYPLRARTTSMFLEEFDLQAAINANHFSPFERENARTYLAASAGAKSVLGAAASNGAMYGERKRYCSILHIQPDNHAEILSEWPQTPYTAIAGISRFIVDGVAIEIPRHPSDAPDGETAAISAVGIDQTGGVLFLVAVDGELAPYSAGIDLNTLAEVLLSHGVYNALGLDGGGSSTMVIENWRGSARLVNRPVQGGLLCIERPVGNHIGVYARRLEGE